MVTIGGKLREKFVLVLRRELGTKLNMPQFIGESARKEEELFLA